MKKLKKLLRKISMMMFVLRLEWAIRGFLHKFKRKTKIIQVINGYPYNDQRAKGWVPMPVWNPTTPRDGFHKPSIVVSNLGIHSDKSHKEAEQLIKVDGSPFTLTDLINHHINDKRETNMSKAEILQQASYAKTLIEQIEVMCKDKNEISIIENTLNLSNIKKEI